MEKPIVEKTHFIQEILSIGQTLSNETYIEIKTNNEEHTLIFQTFELLEWLDTNELKRSLIKYIESK
tara:strand:+ start:20303 stop:20503 length:201 start_codon:yes stop_codon:yes gene_type:complete